MSAPAPLLTPSRLLGGGIERYVETVEWACADKSPEYQRVDLQHSGAVAHAPMLSEARGQLRAITTPARLVVAHRSLLPVAWLLTHGGDACGISVLCHGNDVWGTRGLVRGGVENRQMRRTGLRIVAASNFTAGALAGGCRATVLPPRLSREWFDTLVKVSADTRARGAPHVGMHLVTAFRLGHGRDKELPEMLTAVAALDRPNIQVTVRGSSGDPPLALEQLVREHLCSALRPRCTDSELAHEFAKADLFVLATRTTGGWGSCGEGFGPVLLEALIAGTRIVGPAYGGSRDAYVDGVTGIAPADESAGELAKILDQLDPARLAEMGRRAAEWARKCFSPERYAPRAIERLL